MTRYRPPKEIGVGFESEEEKARAYRVINRSDYPFEIVPGGPGGGVIVPEYVKEELDEVGVRYYEFEVVNALNMPCGELRRIKREHRKRLKSERLAKWGLR